MTNLKNQCERVDILSEDKITDTVEIKFLESDIRMSIPRSILKNKIDTGFYLLSEQNSSN